jgi:hypothetical protein
MDVDEVVNNGGAETKRAASGWRQSAVRRVSSTRNRGDDRRRWGTAQEQFGGRESSSDTIGAEAGGKRKAKGGRELVRQVVDQWKRFSGGKVRVKDKER